MFVQMDLISREGFLIMLELNLLEWRIKTRVREVLDTLHIRLTATSPEQSKPWQALAATRSVMQISKVHKYADKWLKNKD